MNAPIIATIMHAAVNCLEDGFKDDSSIAGIVDLIKSMDFGSDNFSKLEGQIPAHVEHLDTAISAIDNVLFADLKTALAVAKDQLHWKIDDGAYYSIGADVGEGYREGNMHTLLVGPENAVIKSSNFLLGLFLLTPWTLYRDHKHLAPEIYVPLTGPSGWRFGLGDWEDHDAGSRIYNAPEVVHATRVYETPFLALFAWTGDINSICSVVCAKDWSEVEQQLNKRSRICT